MTFVLGHGVDRAVYDLGLVGPSAGTEQAHQHRGSGRVPARHGSAPRLIPSLPFYLRVGLGEGIEALTPFDDICRSHSKYGRRIHAGAAAARTRRRPRGAGRTLTSLRERREMESAVHVDTTAASASE